jgi:hypothetical protein
VRRTDPAGMSADDDKTHVQQRSNEKRFDSWKEISSFFGKDERTVQRWEKEYNLPIHRRTELKKSRVWAFRHELENWEKEHSRQLEAVSNDLQGEDSTGESGIDRPQSPRGTRYLRQTIIDTGFLGGAVAGAIVGLAYYARYHSRYPLIGLMRVALVITYGIFAGSAFGATIQFGIPALQRLAERHSLISRNRWAEALFLWVVAVFLCVLTGIFAGALCALFFWAQSGGPPVSWALVVFGFLIATVAIALGAIFDEYKWNLQTVSRAIQVSVGVWFGHFAIGTLVVLAFDNALNSAFNIPSFGGPPLVAGCLIGIMIGALMGSQISVTLVFFRSWQRENDRRDAGGGSHDTPANHTHSQRAAT